MDPVLKELAGHLRRRVTQRDDLIDCLASSLDRLRESERLLRRPVHRPLGAAPSAARRKP